MGRFFKATKASFLDDTMYKAPIELMKEVIQTNDKKFNEGQDVLNAFDEQIAKLETLDFNEQEKQEKLKDLYQQRDFIINAMNKNKVDFKRYLPNIRKLSREFQEDITSGRFHEMTESKKRRDLLKQNLEKSGVGKEYIDDVIKAYDNQFQAGGNKLYSDSTDYAEYIDINSVQESLAKTIQADMFNKSIDKAIGNYFITDVNGHKRLSPEKIGAAFDNDERVRKYKDMQYWRYKNTYGLSDQEALNRANLDVQKAKQDTIAKLQYNQTTIGKKLRGNSIPLQEQRLNMTVQKYLDETGRIVKTSKQNYTMPTVSQYFQKIGLSPDKAAAYKQEAHDKILGLNIDPHNAIDMYNEDMPKWNKLYKEKYGYIPIEQIQKDFYLAGQYDNKTKLGDKPTNQFKRTMDDPTFRNDDIYYYFIKDSEGNIVDMKKNQTLPEIEKLNILQPTGTEIIKTNDIFYAYRNGMKVLAEEDGTPLLRDSEDENSFIPYSTDHPRAIINTKGFKSIPVGGISIKSGEVFEGVFGYDVPTPGKKINKLSGIGITVPAHDGYTIEVFTDKIKFE